MSTRVKKILGIIILVGALALLGTSRYIKIEIGEGKEKIAKAQKKIDQGDAILGLSPVTRNLGVTGGAKKKIASAKDMVAYYERLADTLEICGFALLAVGGFLLVLVWNEKRK